MQCAITSVIGILFVQVAFSQCRDMASKGLTKLGPYQFDGQAEYRIEEGKSIELISTFSAREQYRILYAASEYWDKTVFKIYEKQNRKLLFSNQLGSDLQHWDFKSKSTQDYIIEISVPAQPGGTPKKGCVAILIGIKP